MNAHRPRPHESRYGTPDAVDPAGPDASLGRGRAHRSLENAERFPQAPQHYDWLPLDPEGRFSDTTSTRVAGFQPFPCGRFSVFGDNLCAPAHRRSGLRQRPTGQQGGAFVAEGRTAFSDRIDELRLRLG